MDVPAAATPAARHDFALAGHGNVGAKVAAGDVEDLGSDWNAYLAVGTGAAIAVLSLAVFASVCAQRVRVHQVV